MSDDNAQPDGAGAPGVVGVPTYKEACEAIRALLAEVDRLRAEVDQSRAKLEQEQLMRVRRVVAAVRRQHEVLASQFAEALARGDREIDWVLTDWRWVDADGEQRSVPCILGNREEDGAPPHAVSVNTRRFIRYMST